MGGPFQRRDWLVSPGKCRLKGWGLLPGSVLEKLPKPHLSREKRVQRSLDEVSVGNERSGPTTRPEHVVMGANTH